MRNELLLILAVIGSILTFASLTGFVLRISAREGAAIGVIENLNTRIKAWWVIVLILGSTVLAGRAAVIVLFAPFTVTQAGVMAFIIALSGLGGLVMSAIKREEPLHSRSWRHAGSRRFALLFGAGVL
jgi:predicted CDP-diglyceride synthetase/phosphatidate cytidylyltransferase